MYSHQWLKAALNKSPKLSIPKNSVPDFMTLKKENHQIKQAHKVESKAFDE